MSTLYACSNHIELMEMEQEWILVDTEGFTITKINRMGAMILEAVKELRSPEEIVDMIQMNYEVDSNQARQDINAFLQELQRIGIIYERTLFTSI